MSLDIDFVEDKEISEINDIEVLKNYEGLKVEVKTDDTNYYRTNLVFELVSNTIKNTKGWALITECDLLVYAFPKKDRVYTLDGKRLREFIESIQNDSSYKKNTRSTLDHYGRKLYSSIAVLVSLEELVEKKLVLQVFDFKNKEEIKSYIECN